MSSMRKKVISKPQQTESGIYQNIKSRIWQQNLRKIIDKLHITNKFSEIEIDFILLFSNRTKIKLLTTAIEREGLIHNLDENLVQLKTDILENKKSKSTLADDLAITISNYEINNRLNIPHFIEILRRFTMSPPLENTILLENEPCEKQEGKNPEEKLTNLISQLQKHKKFSYSYQRLSKILENENLLDIFLEQCEKRNLFFPLDISFIRTFLTKETYRRCLLGTEQCLFEKIQRNEIKLDSLIDVLIKTAKEIHTQTE